jgi:hypothetical protein
MPIIAHCPLPYGTVLSLPFESKGRADPAPPAEKPPSTLPFLPHSPSPPPACWPSLQASSCFLFKSCDRFYDRLSAMLRLPFSSTRGETTAKRGAPSPPMKVKRGGSALSLSPLVDTCGSFSWNKFRRDFSPRSDLPAALLRFSRRYSRLPSLFLITLEERL